MLQYILQFIEATDLQSGIINDHLRCYTSLSWAV